MTLGIGFGFGRMEMQQFGEKLCIIGENKVNFQNLSKEINMDNRGPFKVILFFLNNVVER